MHVGNDDDIARIIRPPSGRDKSRYQLVLVNNVLLAVIFALASLHEQTERASIIIWCVIKHVFYLFRIMNLPFTYLSFGLRACLKRLGSSQPTQHQASHSDVYHGFAAA